MNAEDKLYVGMSIVALILSLVAIAISISKLF